MKNYILGTHNSLTYAPLKNWWLYPILFTAKCQQLSYKQQYEKGSRVFDLRINFKNGIPVIRHGMFEFKINIYEVLQYLNNQKNCWCRILLEFNFKPKDYNDQIILFKDFCYKIEKKYSNINFFGGNSKFSWEVLYDFKKDITLDDQYSSVQCKNIGKIFPFLFSKLNNKKILQQGTDKECLFIDFIK